MCAIVVYVYVCAHVFCVPASVCACVPVCVVIVFVCMSVLGVCACLRVFVGACKCV